MNFISIIFSEVEIHLIFLIKIKFAGSNQKVKQKLLDVYIFQKQDFLYLCKVNKDLCLNDTQLLRHCLMQMDLYI